MQDKHFVNYENSKTMQQLGFDNEDFAFYWVKYRNSTKPVIDELDSDTYRDNDCITASLWQQVVEWLDSKFGIAFVINFDSDMDAVLHDILEQILIKQNGKLK